MVARIVSGKSIRGVLNYNENKVKNSEAALLMAAGFPRGPEGLNFRNKLERFEMLTRQNKMTLTNAMHITLNFSPKDLVDELKLQAIAIDYMERIGFGSQPYLVYQHYDAAHPHIHIATVNIADGGQRIETHNIGKNQSEKARKEIEVSYGLIKAEDQAKETSFMMQPVNLEKVIYGKAETKAAISSIVREVTGTYKFTSLPELNAALRQFNVLAYPGAPGTRMNEKGGLVYCLLDEKGEAAGIPIKASSIYSSPTLKNLEKKYPQNKEARKPYGQRLRHLLDKGIQFARSREEFEASLRTQGIRMLLRENEQGLIYGLTFIDNATRSVFKGSDLGKAYSAKAFLERIPTEANKPLESVLPIHVPKQEPAAGTKTSNANFDPAYKNYPASDQPVILTLIDIALSDTYEENMPDPFRKKRKKRLQTE
jgi:hypothetical protein